jgi:hypothetical protein
MESPFKPRYADVDPVNRKDKSPRHYVSQLSKEELDNLRDSLLKNLGILTFNPVGGSQIGIDRDMYKNSIHKLNPRNPNNSEKNLAKEKWRFLVLLEKKLITNLKSGTQSADSRDTNPLIITRANEELNKFFGTKVIVKNAKLSGDGKTAKEQFEAGKILQKVLELVDLTSLVEVNKALCYTQNKKQSLIFSEEVVGYTFQQLQKGKIFKDKLKTQIPLILKEFKQKLELLKVGIKNHPEFENISQATQKSGLEFFLQWLNYQNQKTSLDKKARQENSQKYPQGVKFELAPTHFYQKTENFKNLKYLIAEIEGQIKKPNSDCYNLIAEAIYTILYERSSLAIGYFTEIKKTFSYGQDNLMWNTDYPETAKCPITIIDPGPIGGVK